MRRAGARPLPLVTSPGVPVISVSRDARRIIRFAKAAAKITRKPGLVLETLLPCLFRRDSLCFRTVIPAIASHRFGWHQRHAQLLVMQSAVMLATDCVISGRYPPCASVFFAKDVISKLGNRDAVPIATINIRCRICLLAQGKDAVKVCCPV